MGRSRKHASIGSIPLEGKKSLSQAHELTAAMQIANLRKCFIEDCPVSPVIGF
jgi:hypothetical protein